MSIPTKKVQKKLKSDHSVFRKQENSKGSLNKQNSSAQDILTLHQTLGNQAVQRLFKSGFIQGKLTIGKPNDKYEQEADRVAEEVMRMPEPQVQRQSEEDEEEEMIQPKPIIEQITPLVQRQVEEEEEEIQAKAEGQTPQVAPNLESRINALQGGGKTLPVSERAFFEPRFGADFSNVRVHNDNRAGLIARSINARAFTLGRDIVFGPGQYSPGSISSRRLLAHELTHIVQQGGGWTSSKAQHRESIEFDPIDVGQIVQLTPGSDESPSGNGGCKANSLCHERPKSLQERLRILENRAMRKAILREGQRQKAISRWKPSQKSLSSLRKHLSAYQVLRGKLDQVQSKYKGLAKMIRTARLTAKLDAVVAKLRGDFSARYLESMGIKDSSGRIVNFLFRERFPDLTTAGVAVMAYEMNKPRKQSHMDASGHFYGTSKEYKAQLVIRNFKSTYKTAGSFWGGVFALVGGEKYRKVGVAFGNLLDASLGHKSQVGKTDTSGPAGIKRY